MIAFSDQVSLALGVSFPATFKLPLVKMLDGLSYFRMFLDQVLLCVCVGVWVCCCWCCCFAPFFSLHQSVYLTVVVVCVTISSSLCVDLYRHSGDHARSQHHVDLLAVALGCRRKGMRIVITCVCVGGGG
jgi:hypothetical protein